MQSGTGKQPRLSTRQAARRAEILSVARRLIAERGSDATTMKLVAEESGVAEKTLYNIYGGKAALVAAATQDRTDLVFAAARQASDARGWPALKRIADEIAAVSIRQPEIARALVPLLFQPDNDSRLKIVYDRHVLPELESMARAGDLVANAPTSVLSDLIRRSFVAAVHGWAGGLIADDALAPRLISLLATTVLPYAPPERASALAGEARGAIERLAVITGHCNSDCDPFSAG